ncbi:hypothetical protein B0I08_10686 [Glaciihabitans tibetensis]|uniref:Cytoplasmic protein n=1 Tax=Glaciihabitans tibetensis TaxID=1266600 RepID=A0A2T0VB98_9MICO|nr:cytoplasmic protein [Glaciihabitans tibetensis]PRY67479.1 hypothetical protein B0I08_10686 [Glaciihabitans tibetensis]
MSLDPVVSNPDFYRVIFENERVRVLEYGDAPGDKSTPHGHPDSVMVTLSTFRRRLAAGGRELEVELPTGAAVWLPAQTHTGENIGATETRTIFVELKEPDPNPHSGPTGVGGTGGSSVTGGTNKTQPLGPN